MDPGYWVYNLNHFSDLYQFENILAEKDHSSYGLNTLGPLCLWQCLSVLSAVIGFKHFACIYLFNLPPDYHRLPQTTVNCHYNQTWYENKISLQLLGKHVFSNFDEFSECNLFSQKWGGGVKGRLEFLILFHIPSEFLPILGTKN